LQGSWWPLATFAMAKKTKPWRNITLVESPQWRKHIFLKMWRLCQRCANNIHILGTEIIQTCTHYPTNSAAGQRNHLSTRTVWHIDLAVYIVLYCGPRYPFTLRQHLKALSVWAMRPLRTCIPTYDSRLRRANYKCAIAVRRIGTERDVCSISIACCGGIDRVSLTGFAVCVELAECAWSMHECVDTDEWSIVHECQTINSDYAQVFILCNLGTLDFPNCQNLCFMQVEYTLYM
jgi:hypothetical protein